MGCLWRDTHVLLWRSVSARKKSSVLVDVGWSEKSAKLSPPPRKKIQNNITKQKIEDSGSLGTQQKMFLIIHGGVEKPQGHSAVSPHAQQGQRSSANN